MTENRYRPSSPPGRRYAEPRTSTGTVYSSSYEPRYPSSQPRPVIDSFPVARHGSVYSTQGVARKTVLDDNHPGGGSVIRTEYPVRPRNNSTIESRRPVSAFIDRRSSPPRARPAIVGGSTRDDPRSSVSAARDDRYLLPAASQGRHHHRHSSANRTEQDHLNVARANRQPEYHRRGGYNAYPYSSTTRGPLQDEGFSYTTPKEHFLQESARPRPRRDSHSRRERPVSIIGLPEYRLPPRRDTRDGPPLSSSRVLDRIERGDPARHSSARLSDTEDRTGEFPQRRLSTRAPVLHHYPDDGYSSAREERDARLPPKPRYERIEEDDRPPKHKHRDDREREVLREPPREHDRPRDRDRDRERDKDRDRDRDRPREVDKPSKVSEDRRLPRSRESSPDHSGLRKGLAAAGLGTAGALAAAAVKSSRNAQDESGDDDRKERKSRRRRHHHPSEEPSPDELAGRIERDLTLTNGERGGHDRRRDDPRVDDVDRGERHERRKHRHRKQRDKAEREDESDTESSTGKDTRQRQYEREREREAELREPSRPRRERAPSRDNDRDIPPSLEQRTISPGDEDDGRPRRVQLVEPVDKREEIKPKGILKPPREVPFPEDPNPEREGVAPLKDATKTGIPPGARWTKISRALVNPEALEKAHERFEERDDYVIVLRVVSKEEIMKFAEKTKEVREERERRWQAELEERRRRRKEGGHNDSSSDADTTDDEKRPRLAIADAPPIQGDPRAYLAQQQFQQQREQVPIGVNPPGPPAMAPLPQQHPSPGMPVPDIKIEPHAGNYSNEV